MVTTFTEMCWWYRGTCYYDDTRTMIRDMLEDGNGPALLEFDVFASDDTEDGCGVTLLDALRAIARGETTAQKVLDDLKEDFVERYHDDDWSLEYFGASLRDDDHGDPNHGIRFGARTY